MNIGAVTRNGNVYTFPDVGRMGVVYRGTDVGRVESDCTGNVRIHEGACTGTAINRRRMYRHCFKPVWKVPKQAQLQPDMEATVHENALSNLGFALTPLL